MIKVHNKIPHNTNQYNKRQLLAYFAKECVFAPDCSLAITLTQKMRSAYGEPLDYASSVKNFRFFMNRLNSKILGNRFRRKGHKIKVIPVIETSKLHRLHYHAIMEIPADYLDKRELFTHEIERAWSKTPFGFHQTKVDPIFNASGWLSYMGKFRDAEDEVDVRNISLEG